MKTILNWYRRQGSENQSLILLFAFIVAVEAVVLALAIYLTSASSVTRVGKATQPDIQSILTINHQRESYEFHF